MHRQEKYYLSWNSMSNSFDRNSVSLPINKLSKQFVTPCAYSLAKLIRDRPSSCVGIFPGLSITACSYLSTPQFITLSLVFPWVNDSRRLHRRRPMKNPSDKKLICRVGYWTGWAMRRQIRAVRIRMDLHDWGNSCSRSRCEPMLSPACCNL